MSTDKPAINRKNKFRLRSTSAQVCFHITAQVRLSPFRCFSSQTQLNSAKSTVPAPEHSK